MRVALWSLAIVALAATACASQPVESSGAPTPDGTPGKRTPGRFGDAERSSRVAGEYIVGLESGADPERVKERFVGYGIAEWRLLREDTWLLHVQQDPGPEAFAEAAKTSPGIRYIEPNRIYTIPR